MIYVIGGTYYDSEKATNYLKSFNLLAEPIAISDNPEEQYKRYSNPNSLTNYFIEKTKKIKNSTLIIYCNSLSFWINWKQADFNNNKIIKLTDFYKSFAISSDSIKVGLITFDSFTLKMITDYLNYFNKNISIIGTAEPELVSRFEKEKEAIVRKELELKLGQIKDKGSSKIILGCTHFDFLEFTPNNILQPGKQVLDNFISYYHG